jgi:hypothetical protein
MSTRDPTAPKVTCLLTIHGIGFQQPPVGDVPGYADNLHRNLKKALPDLVSDDPGRQRSQPGEAGAIYAQSEYPTASHKREEGLRRLGVWDQTHRTIKIDDAPLVDEAHKDREAIAHIALVYASLEDVAVPHIGSAVDAGIRSLLASGRYLSIRSSPGWLRGVVRGLSRGGSKAANGPCLRVRSDIRGMRQAKAAGRAAVPSEAPPDGGLGATILQLENDVCAYVCRNDLRVRVRAFVREALFRLCSRDDVRWVIVNAHSQGTVVAFDVLSGLPPVMAAKIPAVYTFGSPLRKYLDLFAWGNDVGILNGSQWLNFWDACDPVADPLTPGPRWKVGMPVSGVVAPPTLFQYWNPDGGDPVPVGNIADRPVDNLAKSADGGLKAHNYWDNVPQVVEPLAKDLARWATSAPVTQPVP